MKRFFVILGLVCLTACKQPQAPTPQDEPDTARSTVSAIVNNTLWQFNTLDTLSKGPLTNAGALLYNDPITNLTFARHENRITESRSLSFSFRRQGNLILKDVIGPNNIQVMLRSWSKQGFGMGFLLPTYINTNTKIDSLLYAEWQDFSMTEQYRETSLPSSSGPTTYGVYPVPNLIKDINYHLYSKDNSVYENRYNARIERAWLIIDRYDREKKRISGRFSFRLVSRVDSSVVDIQNGSFDNVRMVYNGD